MATPNSQILRGAPLKCGIILGVSPSSDPTFDVELVRASSGVYSTVARLTNLSGGVPVTYEDLLPYTTQSYTYKARAVKQGWLAGDYTDVLEVRPLPMPEILPKITPLTGKGIGSPLFISTGAVPTYGRAVARDPRTQALTVYGFECLPVSNAVSFTGTTAALYPNTTAAAVFQWKNQISPGSSVTTFTISYRRPSTKGTLRVRYKSGVTTFIDYTATGAAAGLHAKAFSSGFVLPASSFGNNLYMRVDITSTSGTTGSVFLTNVDIVTKQPTVATAL